jgi:hypothetical protein
VNIFFGVGGASTLSWNYPILVIAAMTITALLITEMACPSYEFKMPTRSLDG